MLLHISDPTSPLHESSTSCPTFLFFKILTSSLYVTQDIGPSTRAWKTSLESHC